MDRGVITSEIKEQVSSFHRNQVRTSQPAAISSLEWLLVTRFCLVARQQARSLHKSSKNGRDGCFIGGFLNLGPDLIGGPVVEIKILGLSPTRESKFFVALTS